MITRAQVSTQTCKKRGVERDGGRRVEHDGERKM